MHEAPVGVASNRDSGAARLSPNDADSTSQILAWVNARKHSDDEGAAEASTSYAGEDPGIQEGTNGVEAGQWGREGERGSRGEDAGVRWHSSDEDHENNGTSSSDDEHGSSSVSSGEEHGSNGSSNNADSSWDSQGMHEHTVNTVSDLSHASSEVSGFSSHSDAAASHDASNDTSDVSSDAW